MLAAAPPFPELFHEHAPAAGRALRHLGVAEADLPDALQETFLVVFRKLPERRGESSLRTWIYGICLRVAAKHRRRPHRSREAPLDEGALDELPAGDAAPDPHREAEQRQALARLDQVLSELDDDKRAVFVLYEMEELTLAEVAAAVGAPIPTVYSRLQAARKRVHAAFGEGEVGAEKGHRS